MNVQSGDITLEGDPLEFEITLVSEQATTEIWVQNLDGNTLDIQKYDADEEEWYSTGDDALTEGVNSCSAVTGGKYRVKCTSGSGTSQVRIEAV